MAARRRWRLAAAFGGLAVLVGLGREAAPGRDLEALATALSRAADGAKVDAADVRWEPSGGAVVDAAIGRWALFLARRPGEDARDVWRARVRVTPEGAALDVSAAHDLTNTPLGDDHELVVNGPEAAFATRAYAQEQSLTVLTLGGEGAQNRTTAVADRAMAAITNLQQTGTFAGVGRVDITLETPAPAVALELSETVLDVTLLGPGGCCTSSDARFDLTRGDLAAPVPGMRVDGSIHLPKRFSHWLVDTARAVPSIGPAPVAWLEDQALAARDSARRFAFRSTADADVVATAEPPPPVLDTSQASVEEAHWPPPSIPTIWKEAEAGEGEWTVPDVPWLRSGSRVGPGVASDAPSAFYQTFVRPDQERPYAKVLLVAMDLRQLDLDMEAGVEDPEPLTGPHGSGRLPRDPAVYHRVLAAFNGAFKTEHGHYGMMVHKRVLLPPVPAAATVVVLDDGRVGFGTWGAERRVGGVLGVPDASIVSFRQNLDALLDHGRINPTGRNLWGFTLPGKGAQTERSGLCATASGHLVYAWGDDVSATTLAKALQMSGCDYAMHLDMNPYHTGFLFTNIDDITAKKYKSQLLTSGMSIPTDRYIQYAPKDFFYVMVHDPRPPQVDGGSPWAADGGAQPPPRWLPGVWKAQVDGPGGAVELLDIESGRATWRVRAGTKDAPASAPLRELAGDDARRVLLAIGLGVAREKHPLGLATDGRLAIPVSGAHGGSGTGILAVDAEGHLTMALADRPPVLGPHDDLVELPLLLWDGHASTPTLGAAAATGASGANRAAIGFTDGGRVLVARGSFTDAAPLADALSRAGCTRALLLDRGIDATAFVDRTDTGSPPRARYDQSVLYAVGTPLQPRGFRFDASTVVAQASKSK